MPCAFYGGHDLFEQCGRDFQLAQRVGEVLDDPIEMSIGESTLDERRMRGREVAAGITMGATKSHRHERDLLVQEALAQHHEDAHLLRREGGQARHQLRRLARRHVAEVDVGRQPHLAAHDPAHGIPDRVDKCPDDPEDKDDFEDQDGCPDLDNDQDGILDVDDLCPNDPEDKDNFEDADGCPEPDNDKDRILDQDDSCPRKDGETAEETAEVYNGVDDSDGCPDRGKVIVTDTKIEILDKNRVYARDLPNEIIDAVYAQFRDALLPLYSAGKLGAVFLQYPRWVFPSNESRDAIVEAKERLGDLDVAVEFRHNSWLNAKNVDRTLAFLEKHGIALVMVDEPQGMRSSLPPMVGPSLPTARMPRSAR